MGGDGTLTWNGVYKLTIRGLLGLLYGIGWVELGSGCWNNWYSIIQKTLTKF